MVRIQMKFQFTYHIYVSYSTKKLSLHTEGSLKNYAKIGVKHLLIITCKIFMKRLVLLIRMHKYNGLVNICKKIASYCIVLICGNNSKILSL